MKNENKLEILISVYHDNAKVAHKFCNSFESAVEAIGKLERFYPKYVALQEEIGNNSDGNF